MDSTLSELAVAGAKAIVQLMASDAWGSTKKLVAKLFSTRPDRAQGDIAAELEESRARVATVGAIDSEAQLHEQDRWEAILRLRLLEEPTVAQIIAQILDLAQSDEAGDVRNTGHIVMKAEARDNARVYQQGNGIQHNG